MKYFRKKPLHKPGNPEIIKKFIKLAGTVDDTPELIRHIAANKQFLSYCLAAVKANKNSNPDLLRMYHDLKKETHRQGFSFDKIMEKLTPVASALGLNPETPDSIHENYYEILRIKPNANSDAIKKAYRKKAMQFHPDVLNGKQDQFIAIHEAYKVLSDPASRHYYDLRRKQSIYPKWTENTKTKSNKFSAGFFQTISLKSVFAVLSIVLFLGSTILIADFVIQQQSLSDNRKYSQKLDIPDFDNKKDQPETVTKEKKPQTQEDGLLVKKDVSESINVNTLTVIQKQKEEIRKLEEAKIKKPSIIEKKPPIEKPPAIQQPLLVSIPSEIQKTDKEMPGGESDSDTFHVDENDFISRYWKHLEVAKADDHRDPVPEKVESPDLPMQLEIQTDNVDPQDHDKEVPEKESGSDIFQINAKLNDFISRYCKAYEDLDLNRFLSFFSDNATENGKPLVQLLPQYQNNFNALESIQYTIELLNHTVDSSRDRIVINGLFSLKWRGKQDNQSHFYHGNIQMALVPDPDNDSFAVEELNYGFEN